MSNPLWPHRLQLSRVSCPSEFAEGQNFFSQSLLTVTSIVLMMPSNHLILGCLFSSCPQSFPASRSFPMSCFFISGGQSVGASASASVLPMNIQGWFPLGLTGLISLQSKGISRVFSDTTVGKHQFFGTQPSLRTNPHICTRWHHKWHKVKRK